MSSWTSRQPLEGQTCNRWCVKCSSYKQGTFSLKKDTNMLRGFEYVFLDYDHWPSPKGGYEGDLALWVVFDSEMLLREMEEVVPGLLRGLCWSMQSTQSKSSNLGAPKMLGAFNREE